MGQGEVPDSAWVRERREDMKKTNRIMMVQGMVNTLVDSIRDYENFENRNGYPPMYGNTDQYNTKESIRRRIVQARAELNQLAKEL